MLLVEKNVDFQSVLFQYMFLTYFENKLFSSNVISDNFSATHVRC